MIEITQLKLRIPHTEEDLKDKLLRTLRIQKESLISYRISRRSLDARRKPELYYVYTLEVHAAHEELVAKKAKSNHITLRKQAPAYHLQPSGTETLPFRPIIVGTGPAGLFCGYELARMGYAPILLERGAPVEERIRDVEQFWNTGKLDADSNVQFGEGGAGTFSDGKLNTAVRDRDGRNYYVLQLFVEHGAPEAILYDSKPHVGTDILVQVVQNMRNSICRMGGEIHFHTKVTDIHTRRVNEEACIEELKLLDGRTGQQKKLAAKVAVFAIGHSARDTFAMLRYRGIAMQAKAFAVGVRIEHPQMLINDAQYGEQDIALPAAAYKLTANLHNGRGVYTFCMCPGGYVVNASSEEGMLAVNGMSYSKRDGKNANSAVIVTVTPEDYGNGDALSGLAFQRRLEQAAYELGSGRIPVQLLADFRANRPSTEARTVLPQMKGGYRWSNVRQIFPEFIAEALLEGIDSFNGKIPGFASGDALLSGVESRTSSPVRILRDDSLQNPVRGLYPCGEGAGYAGGIMSAAMDGLKTAEAISKKYCFFDSGQEGLRNF